MQTPAIRIDELHTIQPDGNRGEETLQEAGVVRKIHPFNNEEC